MGNTKRVSLSIGATIPIVAEAVPMLELPAKAVNEASFSQSVDVANERGAVAIEEFQEKFGKFLLML